MSIVIKIDDLLINYCMTYYKDANIIYVGHDEMHKLKDSFEVLHCNSVSINASMGMHYNNIKVVEVSKKSYLAVGYIMEA